MKQKLLSIVSLIALIFCCIYAVKSFDLYRYYGAIAWLILAVINAISFIDNLLKAYLSFQKM